MREGTTAERQRWQRIEALLDQALDLPSQDRSAFLDAALNSQPGLRRELEELLAADQGAGRFLDAPIHEVAATFVDGFRQRDEAQREGQSLGRYQLRRHLGGGGMGEVYEAWDSRLERRVALKLLPAAWIRDPAARQRFLQEAKIASGLDHPNLCTLHDVGESDQGQPYLVMTYYLGETLAKEIARGALDVERFRRLAIQLTLGLEKIHTAGITHRDIKPSNVMVVANGEASSDQVKILDFGIAKTADATGLTATGSSLGTPAYMSPEQVAGGTVDARSDVFSLGVMLYEMLAGRRPFQADDPRAVMHAIEHRKPEPLSRWRNDVPPALEQLVAKALAKKPDERYPTVADLRADLESGHMPVSGRRPRRRWMLAGLVCLALMLTAGWFTIDTGRDEIGPSPSSSSQLASRVSSEDSTDDATDAIDTAPVLAVLPFVNRTGDANLDWYGAGIARLVMDDLAQSRHLHVVSSRRVQALLQPTSSATAAAERGIEMLLTGEILSRSGKLSVAMRLDETDTEGRQLTARRSDELAPEDLLTVADDLARAARRALGVPPTEAVDVFAADFAAENPGAYEDFLTGLQAFVDYRFEAAEHAFNEALTQAPGFTMARYRLAHVKATLGRTDEALADMRRAITESGRLPERDALYVRAGEAYIARRWQEAVDLYRELIERYPYESEARFLLGLLLESLGLHQEVLEQTEVLMRLEPENHGVWSLAGQARLGLGQTHRAVVEIERYLELEPDSANGHHLLASAYRAQGELDLAASEYAQALAVDPQFHFASLDLARIDVLRGQRRAAEVRLEDLSTNPQAPPRHRIDAAFELASLLRSEGRFRRSAEVLARLSDLIAEEQVREAHALADRAAAWMELGDWRQAEELIEQAVARSPGIATRYLFVRGLLELRRQRFAALEETLAEILAGAWRRQGPYRTEEKAAAYLRGLSQLARGDTTEALPELASSVDLEGYEYGIYRLALARAHLEAGQWREAMAAARKAAEERDLQKPRLDLELDRTRARWLLAQVHAILERPEAATREMQTVLDRWAQADPEFTEAVAARRWFAELDSN